MAMHHLFIWPAFGLMIGLAVWRLVVHDRASRRAGRYYLVLATLAVVAIMT